MTHPFLTRLSRFGSADAVVFDGRTVAYADLLALTGQWRARLDRHGVRPGQVVALNDPHSPDACAALLALIERAAVVVPLASVPQAKRDEFHEIAETEWIIEDGRFTRTGRTASHELYAELKARGSAGLVLFSSGTSGRSKASVLDFEKVLARYGEPSRPQRILAFLTLDHIGGINTLLHTLSQGGTLVTIPDRGPDAVFAAIARHRVQVLPTTPTFLNMVLISAAAERHDTSSLRLLTYGTEPMPPRTLAGIRAALPHVRLKQTYGLSELGILPTKSRADGDLWIRLGGPGFEYKIVDGILWIRSRMAMLGYLNAPAPFDEDGFFNTQDVVETDGDYVRVLGRRSEIINVGGEKVYPGEVENVLLEVENIAEATVSGKASPVTGMVVQATVRLSRDEDERIVARRAREHCRTKLDAYKVPMIVRVSEAALHSERMKKIRSAP